MKPIIYFPESCVYTREGMGEAWTGVHVVRAIEHRNRCNLYRRGCPNGRRQHVVQRYGERGHGFTVSENSGTHVRILLGPGRSLSYPMVVQGRVGKAEDANAYDARDGEVR